MLGRYEVIAPIAEGGMAQVLLARRSGIEGFERHVVVKRIHGQLARDPRFVKMFLDEARLAATLHHNNIVQVHDIGRDKDEYFFAMEYVHGEDVRNLLRTVKQREEQVPYEHVIAIITAAACGLHHAHEQCGPESKWLGLVHRDVSPANILVGFDGTVKIADFGIAKAVSAETESTRTGLLKGKVSYMSPEQCMGKPLDRRSDLFSLGIVLYELTTASRLFRCDNEFLTMSSICECMIPPPSLRRPGMAPALEQIIKKALARLPEDRYATAEEMREALEQFAVAEGMRVSEGGLSRYMKKVCGDRPEPWLVDPSAAPEVNLNVDFDEKPAPRTALIAGDFDDPTGIVIHAPRVEEEIPTQPAGKIPVKIPQRAATPTDVDRPRAPKASQQIEIPPLAAKLGGDILLAIADPALGQRLRDELLEEGAVVTWDPDQLLGPSGDSSPIVVVVDGDHAPVGELVEAWREQPTIPGVVAIGDVTDSPVPVVPTNVNTDTLIALLVEAVQQRFTFGMRWSLMRAALDLPPAGADDPAVWGTTLQLARSVAIEIPRHALRPFVHHYVTPTAMLGTLIDRRVIATAELDSLRVIDGTRTVRRIVEKSRDPLHTARMLWGLGSFAALDFTPEVRDLTTDRRREVDELRAHIRARDGRHDTTFYDVLEVTPFAGPEDIEAAYLSLATMFDPEVIAANHDVGDLEAVVQSIWLVIEKARAVLADARARERYHDWLRGRSQPTTWVVPRSMIEAAERAFDAGQRALASGELQRALDAFDTAQRSFPGHPDYEACLAWARYRATIAVGADPVETAVTERLTVISHLLGGRPRPRALVALSLLCVASEDVDSARWYVRKALMLDPDVPGGAQLARRLDA
jgi:eukaryotic-like serine/threonine-protein kinase